MDSIMCFQKGAKTKIHLTGWKIEPSSARSWCGLIKGTSEYTSSTLDTSLEKTVEWTDYCVNCIWRLLYVDDDEDIETVRRFQNIEHKERGVFVVKQFILDPFIERVNNRNQKDCP